jgi:hypothetical protein
MIVEPKLAVTDKKLIDKSSIGFFILNLYIYNLIGIYLLSRDENLIDKNTYLLEINKIGYYYARKKRS